MSKIEIEIKSITGSVLFKYSAKNNTIKETLERAVTDKTDLRGADLYGMTLGDLPQDFINQCSRDMLFIFEHLKPELPFLKEKLLAGEVDGSQYEGECACLIGTLAKKKGNGDGLEKVCAAIPFYEKGTHNAGEQWFLHIHAGDTPENNEFAKHALKLIDLVLDPTAR